MTDKKISQLTDATTPLAGTEVLPIVQSGSTVKVSVDNLTKGKTVNASTFDTDVIAAKVTLSGTTLAAAGTNTNVDINLTPKGTGEVNITKVNIDAGAIDGTAIGANSASTGAFTSVTSTGTATATKLVPTGNVTAGNGMFLPATNTLGFSTDGNERVRITATDLSVGTVSPFPASYGTVTVNGVTGGFFTLQENGVSKGAFFNNNTGVYVQSSTPSNLPLILRTNSSEVMRLDKDANVIVGLGALTTTATNGFLYIPTCPGPPTGTPTALSGRAPLVIDSTNNKLYFYSGGQWRDAGP